MFSLPPKANDDPPVRFRLIPSYLAEPLLERDLRFNHELCGDFTVLVGGRLVQVLTGQRKHLTGVPDCGAGRVLVVQSSAECISASFEVSMRPIVVGGDRVKCAQQKGSSDSSLS